MIGIPVFGGIDEGQDVSGIDIGLCLQVPIDLDDLSLPQCLVLHLLPDFQLFIPHIINHLILLLLVPCCEVIISQVLEVHLDHYYRY